MFICLNELVKNLLQPNPVELTHRHGTLASTVVPTAPHFVNASKVHVMGFSAGGDGTFNLARGMPDLFASANPAAGWATELNYTTTELDYQPVMDFFQNYVNLPVWMQVGEKDGIGSNEWSEIDANGFSRRVKAYCPYADGLQKLEAGLKALADPPAGKTYTHTLSMVRGGNHNNWFVNAVPDQAFDCVKDYTAWFSAKEVNSASVNNTGPRATVSVNMDPIPWSNAITRVADPEFAVWNLNQRNAPPADLIAGCHWEPQRFNYWLFDRKPSVTTGKSFKAVVKAHNVTTNGRTTITIDTPSEYLGIRLRESSTAFGQPVMVVSRDKLLNKSIAVVPSAAFAAEVLTARRDPYMGYTAMLYFVKDTAGHWDVVAAKTMLEGGGEPVLTNFITA